MIDPTDLCRRASAPPSQAGHPHRPLETLAMPTYAYACTDCGHRFETVQSFSDDSLTVCPECQGRLRKLFNAVGVVFKGSGFYRNDSRSDAKSSSGSSSGSGSTSDSSDSSHKAAKASTSSTSGGSSSSSSSSSASSPSSSSTASSGSSTSSGSGSAS